MTASERYQVIYAVQYLTGWGWLFYGMGKDRSHTAARQCLKESRAEFLSWRGSTKTAARKRFRIARYLPEFATREKPDEGRE